MVAWLSHQLFRHISRPLSRSSLESDSKVISLSLKRFVELREGQSLHDHLCPIHGGKVLLGLLTSAIGASLLLL